MPRHPGNRPKSSAAQQAAGEHPDSIKQSLLASRDQTAQTVVHNEASSCCAGCRTNIPQEHQAIPEARQRQRVALKSLAAVQAAGEHPESIKLFLLASRGQAQTPDSSASPGPAPAEPQAQNANPPDSPPQQLGTHAGLGHKPPQGSTAVEAPEANGAHQRGQTFLTVEALQQLPAVTLKLGRLDAAFLAEVRSSSSLWFWQCLNHML